MKILLTVKLHSSIDIITNSSSELFVTNKSLETIKEVLSSVEGCEEPILFNLEEYRNWLKTPDHNKDWDNPFHIIEGWFEDDEDPETIIKIRKEIIEHGPHTYFMGYKSWSSEKDVYRDRIYNAQKKAKPDDWNGKRELAKAEVEKIYEELESSKIKPEWWDKPIKYGWNETPVKNLDGCYLIFSTDDNSIPWEQVEMIEETLNARRFHLG